LSIKIFYDNTNFRIKGWRKVLKVINSLIEENSKIPGEINFIITNDRELKKININFLNHNYFTDVITFNYNEGDVINGEIYMSRDTIKKNSKRFKSDYDEEIRRVMIHGVLHLIGFNDENESEKSIMRIQENGWLKRFDD
jgi:probable rRNA maturation factor